MLTCDAYFTPASLDEAFDLMDRHRGGYRLVAGATDVLPWARQGRAGDVHYDALIDVSAIAELSGIEAGPGDRVRLGANTTLQQFLDEPVLREHLPVMPQCAVWFADDQIRSQATLAGNLVNASPAADATPPMLAMNASVTLIARRDGEHRRRVLRLADFVRGPATTALEEGEILVEVECDSTRGYGSSFMKVGHRRSLVIATVCAAALVAVDEASGRIADARVALGGIGPVPARASEVEAHLRGEPPSRELIEAAAELPLHRIRSRSRRPYRRHVTRGFVAAALGHALAEAGVMLDGETPAEALRYA